MIALQREAKLTAERLPVFVVLNVSCGSAENYHAGTGGGRSFRREQVCLYRYGGMGTLTISRCEGKEVWPRGRVLCMSRIAR